MDTYLGMETWQISVGVCKYRPVWCEATYKAHAPEGADGAEKNLNVGSNLLRYTVNTKHVPMLSSISFGGYEIYLALAVVLPRIESRHGCHTMVTVLDSIFE